MKKLVAMFGTAALLFGLLVSGCPYPQFVMLKLGLSGGMLDPALPRPDYRVSWRME